MPSTFFNGTTMPDNQYCFAELIQQLSAKQDTAVITQDDSRYDQARVVYNRMHDCYPGLIVRTLNIDALRCVIDFAFKHQIILAIRGGGHHIGGFGTCDSGIVIDFSTFKDIHIDTENNMVSVAPGARLADLDRVLCKAGYVVPTGTVSDTGVAGLTLGGGIGWLIGSYGLTCDQLIGADVLLADGRHVRAEDPEHQDLLWALRGGGGNFGIVTTFRFKLNKLPDTICGVGLVKLQHAATVLNLLIHYFHTSCPASVTVAPVFIKNKLRIDFCCANGKAGDVESLLQISTLITWSDVRKWDFPAWQSAFDPAMLPAKRGYWKAAYIETITPEQVLTICEIFAASPVTDCTIMIEQLHGAFRDFNQATSAFPLRHTNFGILISARWIDKAEDVTSIRWVRESFKAIDPKGLSGTYLNYTSADDQRAVQTLVAGTVTRIANVKSQYDPDNYFRRNHNVLPCMLTAKEERCV